MMDSLLLECVMSKLLGLFQAVGPETFSTMVCGAAPYFETITPVFRELEPGHAAVSVPFRREITNHLGTVHAIALCNSAELVGGTMTDASIPEGWRWIPKAMQVQYLAKAKTDVVAVADGKQLKWDEAGDVNVPVTISDANGVEVFKAVITMNIRPGKEQS